MHTLTMITLMLILALTPLHTHGSPAPYSLTLTSCPPLLPLAPVTPLVPEVDRDAFNVRLFAVTPLYTLAFFTTSFNNNAYPARIQLLVRPTSAHAHSHAALTPTATTAPVNVGGNMDVILLRSPSLLATPPASLHPWPTATPPTTPPAGPADWLFAVSFHVFHPAGDTFHRGISRIVLVKLSCGATTTPLWPAADGSPVAEVPCTITVDIAGMISPFPDRICAVVDFLIAYTPPVVPCVPRDLSSLTCTCNLAEDAVHTVQVQSVFISSDPSPTLALDGQAANVTVVDLHRQSSFRTVALSLTHTGILLHSFFDSSRWATVSTPTTTVARPMTTPVFTTHFVTPLSAVVPGGTGAIGNPVGYEAAFTTRARTTILFSYIDEDVLWDPVVLACDVSPGADFAISACAPRFVIPGIFSSSSFEPIRIGHLTPAEKAVGGIAADAIVYTAVAFISAKGLSVSYVGGTAATLQKYGVSQSAASSAVSYGVATVTSMAPIQYVAIATGDYAVYSPTITAAVSIIALHSPGLSAVTLASPAARSVPGNATSVIPFGIETSVDGAFVSACISIGPPGGSVTVAYDPTAAPGARYTASATVPNTLTPGRSYTYFLRFTSPETLVTLPFWVEPAAPTMSSVAVAQSSVTTDGFVVEFAIPTIIPLAPGNFSNTPPHSAVVVLTPTVGNTSAVPAGSSTAAVALSPASVWGTHSSAPIELVVALAPGAPSASVPVSGLASLTRYEVKAAVRTVSGQAAFSAPIGVITEPFCTLGTSSVAKICRDCSPGSYGVGPPYACAECPANTTSVAASTSVLNCTCAVGEYLAVIFDNVDASVCLVCPPGAVCDAGTYGITPVAAPGHFPIDGGVSFVKCPLGATACLGLGRGCAEGYSGFVCNSCADDYFTAVNRECVKCPPGAGGTLFAALLLLSLGTVGWTIVQFFASTFPWELTFARQTGVDLGRQEQMARRIRAPPSLRLAVFVLQLVGLLATVRFAVPPSMDFLFHAAHLFNFDPALFAVECTTPAFATRYIVTILYPLLIVVWVVVLALAIHLLAASSPLLAAKYSPSAGATLGGLVLALGERVFLTLGPILYIPLTRSTFAWLDCSALPLSRGYFVDAAPDVRCFEGAWWGLLPVFIFGLVCYVVAIPAYIGRHLFLARTTLTRLPVMARFGCVYQMWRRKVFFFVLAVLAKHFAITFAARFFSAWPVWVASLLLIISQSWLMIVIAYRPHFQPLHNTLELAYSLALTTLVVICLVFFSDSRPSDSVSNFFEFLGVTTLLVVFVVIVVVAAYETIVLVRASRASRSGSAPPPSASPAPGATAALSPLLASRLNAREQVLWATFLREADDFDNDALKADLLAVLESLESDTADFSNPRRQRVERKASAISAGTTGEFGIRYRSATDDFGAVDHSPATAAVELTSIDCGEWNVRDAPAAPPPARPSRPTRPARPDQKSVSFGPPPTADVPPARPARPTNI